jgi:hypothetical protein
MIYRPSCRVRLQLRIDELSDVSGVNSALGGAQTSQPDQAQRTKANLALMRDVMPPDQFQKEWGAASGQDGTQGAKDDLTVIFECLPEEVGVERNGLKDADTATIRLDHRDVPIDPRIVRACFVTITLGLVEADDYELGIVGKQRRDDGQLVSLVERKDGQETDLHSTTRFSGFVDEFSGHFGEDGDELTLRCRDVSCLLRDVKLQGRAIDLTKPIQDGVQELIDSSLASKGITVVYGTPVDGWGTNAKIQTPSGSPIPAESMQVQKKAKKGKRAKAETKDKNMTVWDHIVDTVARLGLVPVFRGFVLYLLEPRVVFSSLENARKMVWGSNIKSLDFARKLNGVTSDTIEVRCIDPSIGRCRWARYPVLRGEPTSGILGKPDSPQPITSRASKVSPDGTGEETVITISVRGVSDLSMLERIAQTAFHEMGRQEIEGAFETDDIESFESTESADLLDLWPGEPIQVLVAQPDSKNPRRSGSSLQELQAQSVAARTAYLKTKGIQSTTAAKLARAQERAALISTFRAGHVNLDWSKDTGVSVQCDFYNFVVVREDPDSAASATPPAENLSQAQGAVAPRKGVKLAY